MSATYGLLPWQPDTDTKPWLAEVQEVIEANRGDWPLTQRTWLYRLMSAKGWKKVDEYSQAKAPDSIAASSVSLKPCPSPPCAGSSRRRSKPSSIWTCSMSRSPRRLA